jgi:hypothetical protein
MQHIASEYVGPGPVSEQHVHISWRAVLAGILVALAVDVLLSLLGVAVGLTAFEPTAGAAKGVGIGVGIWLILTAIASVFAGAYFGSRVAGDTWKGDGVAHGVLVWAGFILVSLWVMGSGLGKILNSAAGLAGSAVGTLSTPMVNQPRQQAAPAMREPPTAQQAEAAAKKAASDVATGGAVASWVAFGLALLSLGGGAWGGALGAIGEQKQLGRYAKRHEEEERRERERIAPGSPA